MNLRAESFACRKICETEKSGNFTVLSFAIFELKKKNKINITKIRNELDQYHGVTRPAFSFILTQHEEIHYR